MSDEELTSLTLRLPTRLRKRIEVQAKLEDRTASQFVRYHLARVLPPQKKPKGGTTPPPAV